MPMGESKMILRYLGTSGRMIDDLSGNEWEARGEAHEVSAEDAKRLMSLPGEMWEKVLPAEKAAEDKAKAAALKAEAEQAKLAAEAAAKYEAAQKAAAEAAAKANLPADQAEEE